MNFGKLSNWTIRLLYLQIAIGVIGLLSGIMEHSVLRDIQDGHFASQAAMARAGESSNTQQAIVGGLQSLTLIVSGIWILRWIYVACSRARDLTASSMEFSPGWSVAWYFIPFANLWKPYQAMKEIWRVSAYPDNPRIEPEPDLLAVWWFFYIVDSVCGNVSFRLSLRAHEVSDLLTANVVAQASDIAGIPLAITFMILVRRIRNNQEIALSQASAPQPENALNATA
jgi:Domain of unknown function (DUF4328)